MEELKGFCRTPDPGKASEILAELAEGGIKGRLQEIGSPLDDTFGATEITREYEILIKPSDFQGANEILEQNAGDMVNTVADDHYLFGFSNEELYDILLRPDEWSKIDYKLAIEILKKRGVAVDDELLTSLKRQRIADLAKPEESNVGWIIFGYISAAFGGLIGLFLGWHIWKSTKTLPDGKTVHTYSRFDRSHGQIIFYIGCIAFPIALLIALLSKT